MKKSILILSFILASYLLSAQHFYIGGMLGMSINNGFNKDVTTVDQLWQVRSVPYFGAQTGVTGRYDSKGLFKLQLDLIHSKEGNNYFIAYSQSANPEDETNVLLKRTYLRLNIIPSLGGNFSKFPKLGLMGGVGISTGFSLANYPTNKSNSMELWPIDNIIGGENPNFSLLISSTLYWKLGVGLLEFNARYRHSLTASFITPDYKMPDDFNKSFEFNINFIILIKIDSSAP